MTNFNPNQIRDERGRWTDGHVGVEVAQDYDKKEGARRYALAAENVAKALNFDPQRLTVSDEDQKFLLNGHEYFYAGGANLDTGNVTIYANHISPGSIEPTTAHEITHEKFNEYNKDLKAESEAMFNELTKLPSGEGMKADGTLKGGFEKKYPLYQAEAEMRLRADVHKLAESDGITDYSKSWWKAWKDGKANTEQAMHETLAEMGARDYINRPDRIKTYSDIGALKDYDEPAPEWKALYKAITDHWDEKQKKSDKPL